MGFIILGIIYLIFVAVSFYGFYMFLKDDVADKKAGRDVATRRDYLLMIIIFFVIGVIPIMQCLSVFIVISELLENANVPTKVSQWFDGEVL